MPPLALESKSEAISVLFAFVAIFGGFIGYEVYQANGPQTSSVTIDIPAFVNIQRSADNGQATTGIRLVTKNGDEVCPDAQATWSMLDAGIHDGQTVTITYVTKKQFSREGKLLVQERILQSWH